MRSQFGSSWSVGKFALRRLLNAIMAPFVLLFVLLSDTDLEWDWHHKLWMSMVALGFTLLLSCALITASRRSRFVILTSTLQLALLPCYIGIYLALISPTVTCSLILALGALWVCIRASICACFRMCGRSTDVRRGRMSRDQRVLAKKQAKACRREFFALGRRFLFVRSMVIRILALLRFAALLSTTYEMLHYTYHFLAFTYHFLAYLQAQSR